MSPNQANIATGCKSIAIMRFDVSSFLDLVDRESISKTAIHITCQLVHLASETHVPKLQETQA